MCLMEFIKVKCEKFSKFFEFKAKIHANYLNFKAKFKEFLTQKDKNENRRF